MRVLVAPDKLKGTISASRAAAALARGVRSMGAQAIEVPLADGGEGTVDVVGSTAGREPVLRAVDGPAGTSITCEFLPIDDGVLIESAQLCGTTAVGWLGPLVASTEAVGNALLVASEIGERTFIGIGGTATTDGGTGMARAIGWRFLDARGRDLPPGGGALKDMSRIVPPSSDSLPGHEVVGLCDVSSPLLGLQGSARIFGPQKGATAREVQQLEDGLAILAERIRADIGREVTAWKGAGAGGGLGAGVVAFVGGTLTSGAAGVGDLVGLADVITEVDAVITGEGRLDAGSLAGKVVGHVAGLARAAGIPCHLVVGENVLAAAEAERLGAAAIVSLVDLVGREIAMGEAERALKLAGAEAIRRLSV